LHGGKFDESLRKSILQITVADGKPEHTFGNGGQEQARGVKHAKERVLQQAGCASSDSGPESPGRVETPCWLVEELRHAGADRVKETNRVACQLFREWAIMFIGVVGLMMGYVLSKAVTEDVAGAENLIQLQDALRDIMSQQLCLQLS
jgi:hypothetical protein